MGCLRVMGLRCDVEEGVGACEGRENGVGLHFVSLAAGGGMVVERMMLTVKSERCKGVEVGKALYASSH